MSRCPGCCGRSHDDDILITPCVPPGMHRRPARLNVDDFTDPSEEDISEAEIHLTVVHNVGGREEPGLCLQLSVVSARILIRELEQAIGRREGEGGAL